MLFKTIYMLLKPNAKAFFNKSAQSNIIEAIKIAEKNTSGEIRVHLEDKCGRDPLVRAQQLFKDLKMTETQLKNGVLIYIALHDHTVAIWGDEGIHKHVGQAFWEDEIQLIIKFFKDDKAEEGLIKAILKIGENLKKYFPHQSDDTNELTDEISF